LQNQFPKNVTKVKIKLYISYSFQIDYFNSYLTLTNFNTVLFIPLSIVGRGEGEGGADTHLESAQLRIDRYGVNLLF
jgi:hypothetical protein